MKKRAVVICPGRGSYTKENLNYMAQNGAHVADFLRDIDQRRAALGEPTMTELDTAATFSPAKHTKGENASPLIYACSYADYMAINREKYDIVAVTGNSMGWYLALAFAGSLDWAGAFAVINTMGSMMKNEIIGGQVIYPVCDADWKMDLQKVAQVERTLNEINASGSEAQVFLSIQLGGYVVIGGNREGLVDLMKALPPIENYPFQLINHAAFHTPLLRETSHRAFEMLPESLFHKPATPLIDGQGNIWRPYSTDLAKLYHYTLGHQVVETYDFTRAITVALKEFAPDCLILLGPGSSLGGSVGQILIENNWYGLANKAAFTERQARDPFLIAMGRSEQRGLALL